MAIPAGLTVNILPGQAVVKPVSVWYDLTTFHSCWIWPDKCKNLLDMLNDHGISVVYRHRFGADPDPNFHVDDANPDPPDWHQNDVDPHADPTQSLHILEIRKHFLLLAVLRNPDPYVFGPPGSGSVSQMYGSGSGSFYHQVKIVRKTLIRTVPFCDFFTTFYLLKNDVNVPPKSNKQKNTNSRIRIHLSEARIRVCWIWPDQYRSFLDPDQTYSNLFDLTKPILTSVLSDQIKSDQTKSDLTKWQSLWDMTWSMAGSDLTILFSVWSD